MQRMIILLVFVYAGCVQAQVKSQLFVDSEPYEYYTFQDSLALSAHIRSLQIKWLNDGYYFTGRDSITTTLDTINIYLHKGDKLDVQIDGLSGKRVISKLSKALSEYVNNGYPFASMKIDSVRVNHKTLTGKLVIQPGPEVTYDSAQFLSPVKTNHKYVYQLLDIVPDDEFSEKGYKKINEKIKRSSFLELQNPTDLSFKNKKAKIFLDIKEQASNTFQGVVGLQQVPSGETSVVGNIDLDIQNLFRSGKQFQFAWERFSEQSQQLNIFYKHPFLFDSKISPTFYFDLLKQDTTFITRNTGLGIQAYLSPKIGISLVYERAVGTLLSTDIENVSRSGLADFNRTLYKVELFEGNKSYFRNYASSIAWNISISGGRKTIDRNLSLPDTYYDSIQLSTDYFRMEVGLDYQLLVLKRQSFFHSLSAGSLINEELLRNELFRIGGLNSLRGFNEKSIFAQSYMLSRAEFRSYFENESYAYLFYDQLIFAANEKKDAPFGIGLGFALATSSGQFSFALAVGDSETQPISFSAMKAHFGYISKF
ncbi:hypothetical protein [Ekhidna sp.]|uniref:hypothetical protein n=1 Tax=Ekhidna sp. TaxID=2608089 RepID=UPI00329A0973